MNPALALRNVIALSRTKTARSSILVFGSSITAALLSFVVAYFTSRLLGPADYGRLAVANAISALVVGITDFGLSTALVKHTAHQLGDKQDTAPYFQAVFWLEAALGLVVLAATLFTGPIAQLLGGPQLQEPVLFGLIAASFLSVNAFSNAMFQVYGKFGTMASLNAGFATLRTLAFVGLVYFSLLNLHNTLLLNLLIGVLILFVSLAFVPRTGIRASFPAQLAAGKDIFHFSKWLILSYAINAVLSRLDILLLSRLTNPNEVGFYAAALQLASFMPLLLSSLSTVLIPKVTSLPDNEVISYIKKVLTGGVFAIIALSPFIIFSSPLIHLAFGQRFTESVHIFQILFIAYALVLLINPASFLFYKYNKPKLLTGVNLVTGLTQVGLYAILIPPFHGTGAALALLLNTLISLVVISLLLVRLLIQQNVVGQKA